MWCYKCASTAFLAPSDPALRAPAFAAPETKFCDARYWLIGETAMPNTCGAYYDEGNHYAAHVRRSYINTSDLSGLGRIEGLPSSNLWAVVR